MELAAYVMRKLLFSIEILRFLDAPDTDVTLLQNKLEVLNNIMDQEVW